jgi:MFS family permease
MSHNENTLPRFFGVYYGWVIVIVGLVSMAFWLGIRSSFSVFYVALLDNFSWSRGDSAGVQSLSLITYTLLAPVIGGLIDRFGPRCVIGAGIPVLTIGLILCSTIETLTEFYLYFGCVMSIGLTCIGIISYSSILAHWFDKKRGLASGIAVSGMGLGTFFLVPLCQQFISLWGWRTAFWGLGILSCVILFPLNTIFLRHKPEQLDKKDRSGTNSLRFTPHRTDRPLKTIVTTKRFWAVFFFPFFSIIGVYIVLVHNVKFMTDTGIADMSAALVFAIAGIISSIFRIFWGWLSDHIGREITYTMGMICITLSVSSLLLLDSFQLPVFIYSFSLFFGIGWGVTAPMFMAVAADLFTGKNFGLVYGIIEAGIGLAGAFGAWIAGVIFDHTQSYKGAFILSIAFFILSSIIIWFAASRTPKFQPDLEK